MHHRCSQDQHDELGNAPEDSVGKVKFSDQYYNLHHWISTHIFTVYQQCTKFTDHEDNVNIHDTEEVSHTGYYMLSRFQLYFSQVLSVTCYVSHSMACYKLVFVLPQTAYNVLHKLHH